MRFFGFVRAHALLGLILLFFPGAVLADGSYEYHLKSPFVLGKGFDPKFPLRVFAIDCIQSDRRTNVDTNGAVRNDITTTIIRTREQFYSETSYSAKLDAHYAFFSGGSSFSNSKVFSSTADSLTWIVKAEVIFGRYRLVNPHLSQDVSRVTEPERFAKMCGTEFVAQETRGARAMVIFNAKNLSTENKHRLETAVNASVSSIGATRLSASASFRNVINEIKNSAIIEASFQTFGGPGPDLLRSMILDVEDPIKLREGLANYVSRITDGNAAPLTFETASFSQFGVSVPGDLLSNRDNVLTQMNFRYQDIQAVTSRIYSYIKPDDAVKSYLRAYVSDSKREQLELISRRYEKRSNEIYDQAKKCLINDEMCTIPSVTDLERVDFPEIPEVPEPQAISTCYSGDIFFNTQSPPPDNKIVGETTLLVAFVGEVPIKKIVLEDFDQKRNIDIFNLFDTNVELRKTERPLLADDADDKPLAYAKARVRGISVFRFMCRPELERDWGPLDKFRNTSQFAVIKRASRFKDPPITITITDVFNRVRVADLEAW